MKKTTKQFMTFVESISGQNKELTKAIKTGYRSLHENMGSNSLVSVDDFYGLDEIDVTIKNLPSLLDLSPRHLISMCIPLIKDYYTSGAETSEEDEYNRDILNMISAALVNDEIRLSIEIVDYAANGVENDSYGSGERFTSIDDISGEISIPSTNEIDIGDEMTAKIGDIFPPELIELLKNELNDHVIGNPTIQEILSERIALGYKDEDEY